ncbi:MAG: hypothetical protein MK479_10505 [Planctomycetes bacterium]|nr:hypothetical protein [Planctomycetota bacterium]
MSRSLELQPGSQGVNLDDPTGDPENIAAGTWKWESHPPLAPVHGLA